ncbi:ATP-binding protein [Nitratireductor rhodophyticola]|uniref:ATP-binding protein n=1 Tax=Nitratireductor rhodophyticola TaxID=2854036 RepID=UPI0030087E2A
MVLIAGLIVTHIVTIVVFSEHRAASLTRTEEQHIAQHIASIADIVLRVPNEWRDRVVRLTDDHAFRIYTTSSGSEADYRGKDVRFGALNDLLAGQIRAAINEPISVDIRDVGPRDEWKGLDAVRGWLQSRLGRLIYGHDLDQAILVSIPLSQSKRLNFSTVMPLANAPGWEQALAMTGSFVVAVLFLSLWAIRRLSAPLKRFASGATTFAHNIYAPALPETGPSEVREAARAFNEMQRQVRRLVENRAHMLAAISHDLRTPLTTVRLRAENVTDPELRSKMLAALNEMDTMLSSTLAFAREGSANEETCTADVGSLLEAICEDMSEAGHEVTCAVDGQILAPCRPVALKRALTNLVDNSVKYGGKADVGMKLSGRSVEITIADKGPGIPEAEMERIFLPFYRLETSRSRNTGGTGLGMAIAQMIIDLHGGSIDLNNRAGGGLCVRVRLPQQV